MNIFHIKKKIILTIIIFLFNFLSPGFGFKNIRSVELFPQSVEQNDAKIAHYLYETGNYSRALDEYLKLPDKYFSDAKINFRIGVCYLKTFPKEQSLRYLQKAWMIDSMAFENHTFYLAYAHHVNYNFSEAIHYYQASLERGKPTLSQQEETMKRMAECRNAILLTGDTLSVNIKNAGANINSTAPEYRPVPYNESTFYFTSRRRNAVYEIPDPDDNFFYEKVFKANSTEDGTSIDPASRQNELTHASLLYLAADNTAVLYTSQKGNGDIILAEYNNGIIKEKDPLKNINSRFNETSAVLSKNADTLYFVSDRRDMGKGGKDIYFSVKDETSDKWSHPLNLGDKINTSYDEEGVSLSPDGNILYFSSKGHNSMGGYDIFKASRHKNGAWDDITNLGFPVNSPLDEVFFFHAENDKAYFSSNRITSMGDFDIFYADDITPDPEPVAPLPAKPLVVVPDTIVMPEENQNISSQGQFTDISIEITSDDPDSPDNVNVKLQENKELKIFLPLNENGEIDVVIEEFKENNRN